RPSPAPRHATSACRSVRARDRRPSPPPDYSGRLSPSVARIHPTGRVAPVLEAAVHLWRQVARTLGVRSGGADVEREVKLCVVRAEDVPRGAHLRPRMPVVDLLGELKAQALHLRCARLEKAPGPLGVGSRSVRIVRAWSTDEPHAGTPF